MTELVFVKLLIDGIVIARDVIILLRGESRPFSQTDLQRPLGPGQSELPTPATEALPETRTEVIRETRVVRERVMDREHMLEIIEKTTGRLEDLLTLQTQTILDEMKRQRARDAVQEVRARADALKSLLGADDVDTELVTQMVIGALMPLEVSLGKAKYALLDYGNEESWYFCYIVGASALLAGYAYLGYRPGHIERDLLTQIQFVQERVLDELAHMRVEAGKSIPWREVPELLEITGAERLFALYEHSLEEAELATPALDIDKLTITELEETIAEIRTARVVQALIEKEKAGKNRTGALSVLERKRAQLRPA